MSYDFDVVRILGEELLGAYEVSSDLKSSGWVGGLWVRYQSVRSWRDGSSIRWVRILEKAEPDDPMYFLLRGSYEGTDQYTGRYPGKTGIVVASVYGQYLFKYYETNNLAERTVPGSGAPLVYYLNANLYVSSNGLLTSEAEVVNARPVGMCVGLPADNNNYLGCEVLIGPT